MTSSKKYDDRGRTRKGWVSLPTGIWALGFVSLSMDVSSELIHSLLPIFLTQSLGTSLITVGIIEGISEATASITKLFSGAISDYFQKRKLLAVIGYGLGAITKPFFPLATSAAWVFTARFVDRVGKGIRGAPRDALVADLVTPDLRGAAYGLRQSLDSVGALVGPLLAILLMMAYANDIRSALWFGVVPAFLSVGILIAGVKEPAARENLDSRHRLSMKDARRLSRTYWFIVSVGFVFTLARFSEAFLILRAQDVGLAIGLVPLVLVVMNIVYAGVAYPAGVASDRLPPRILLVVGLIALVASDLVLALGRTPTMALIGSGLWGLHMALSQGILARLVADAVPPDLRGTGFGVFHVVSGIALLLASLIAGALWTSCGASATFIAGAAFAALATAGLLILRPRTA